MKNYAFTLLLFALTMCYVPSSAQKAFKEIKTSLKNKKYADALKGVERLEADSAYRGDFRLLDFALQANIGLNDAENTKSYLKQKYDTAAFFSTTLEIIRLSLRADSLAQVYEAAVREGKRPEGAKPLGMGTLKGYVRTYYPNVVAGARWYFRRQKFAEALPLIRAAIDVPDDARLGDAAVMQNADSMSLHLMRLHLNAAYHSKNYAEVHRYEKRLLAITGAAASQYPNDDRIRSARQSVLVTLALTYEAEQNDSQYATILRQGHQEYPESTIFLDRLFLLYIKGVQTESVLSLADEVLGHWQERDAGSPLVLTALQYRAKALYDLQRREEAAATAKEALQRDSTLALMHFYIGEEAVLRGLSIQIPSGNIRSKAYKEAKAARSAVYAEALPHLETYAASPEAEAGRYAPLLYEIYLDQGNAEAFSRIESLMQQQQISRIKLPKATSTATILQKDTQEAVDLTKQAQPTSLSQPATLGENPLLEDFPTPLHSYPFGSITAEHIEAAILEGIEREKQEIDAITAQSEAPTFENTILALERGDQTLSRAQTLLDNLLSAHSNDTLEALSERLTPVLTKHAADIAFNQALFLRVKAVYEQREALPEEARRLVENSYEGFQRSGATLPEAEQKRFREISEELSLLRLQFSQNCRKARAEYVLSLTEAEVDGLPELAKQAAAEEAARRGLEGYAITLQAPSYRAFMTYAKNRERRHELYLAQNTLCTSGTYDNLPLVPRIVNLRLERARLLGFSSYADLVLTKRMAENVENVRDLFTRLEAAYLPTAREEVAAVEQRARRDEGDDFQLMPWDFAFYSHLLKKELYDIDAEQLRPYLPLEKVKAGVFQLATDLYGITFHRRNDIEVYQKDVEVYEVRDTTRQHLGLLYMDFFPRDEKKSGAWMTSFRSQWVDAEGENERPHVSVVFNFTPPTADKPALLTLGEVSTFLHEFGHALHGLFSDVQYASLCSPNVFWDFVELPSQFMENYATEPDFLHTFAAHYQTGEPLPDELVARVRKSRTFHAAYQCMRQVQYGLLDMAYHARTEPFAEPVIPFEQAAWREAEVLPDTCTTTCMTTQFGHIMTGGYAAGYYSYKWAEVLDADAFAFFREHGIFDKGVALSFRQNILSRGNAEHPMTLYRRFRGQEPTIDALLERDGIRP